MDIQDIAMVIDAIQSGFNIMVALNNGGAACTRSSLTLQQPVMDSVTPKDRSSSVAIVLKDAMTISFQSSRLSWSPRQQRVSLLLNGLKRCFLFESLDSNNQNN